MVVLAVLAVSKVLNLKANHNGANTDSIAKLVSKVLNLKANHNNLISTSRGRDAVLAVSKVLNLKANHNITEETKRLIELY